MMKVKKENNRGAEVARDVIDKTIKGEKVIMKDIMEKHGYSPSTCKNPKLNIKKNKDYQEEMAPFLEQLEKERQRLMNAIKIKKLDKMQYEGAVRSLDILTKNVQLLSDKPTENIKGILTEEQVDEIFIRRTKKNSPSREV